MKSTILATAVVVAVGFAAVVTVVSRWEAGEQGGAAAVFESYPSVAPLPEPSSVAVTLTPSQEPVAADRRDVVQSWAAETAVMQQEWSSTVTVVGLSQEEFRPTGTVSGVVLTQAGAPVEGARVSVVMGPEGTVWGESDERGFFLVEEVPVGKRTLTATTEQHEVQEIPIRVARGRETAGVDFALAPRPEEPRCAQSIQLEDEEALTSWLECGL